MSTNYNDGYWDPAGEYEFHDTIYTLAVFVPLRPPLKYLSAFLTREPLDTKPFHVIRSNSPTPDYTCFHQADQQDLRKKDIKIKAHRFPVEFRCKHLVGQRRCVEGCYSGERREGGESVQVCKEGLRGACVL
ncbi:hypothetical protein PSPO01_16684 [Paraphaeosphaeria sporulosa]